MNRKAYIYENLSTILYDELLNKRPVFVCGRGINNGYHAFVCDGYQSGGYFHFNWGWGGKYNAYCLLSKMIPLSGYDYSYNHRVVYRIEPDKLTLNVNEPGTLQELVDLNHADESTTLVVTGKLNGNDILTLRKLAGRDMYNNKTNGILENLDLSLAYIVDGGGCYFKIDDETYYKTQNGTKANIFPDQAFMSTKLKRIKLPSSVNTIGRYSFIFCNDLNEIIWNDQVKKIDFSAFNYTALKTVIIPESVETVGPYAFCNMADLNKVKFSNNIKSIGYLAFEKDNNITEIWSEINKPFGINNNVFSENCYENAVLIIPYGTLNLYKNAEGWKNFKRIIEMEEKITGDVDGNGIVNILDVIKVVNIILGIQK